MSKPHVILIGGAPGVGKTTLGRALATHLGAVSLTADDLLTAAQGVTTPQSHPGLHVMVRGSSAAYFTESSVEQLIADATTQHEATWPAIDKVIRRHAAWGPDLVLDGWALRPRNVVELGLDNVTSAWLVAGPGVLEERERGNQAFFAQSPDPPRMLQNFLGRSLWYNDLIRQQAIERHLPILHQDGHATVDTLLDRVLDATA